VIASTAQGFSSPRSLRGAVERADVLDKQAHAFGDGR
jgi:hypothetical protein